MKLLLDECLDRRLKSGLPGHDVFTVGEMGWAGIKNGRLLVLAQSEFEIFITGDRNLAFQQNVPAFQLAVIVLEAATIRLADTMPLMPKVLAALLTVTPGTVTRITP